MHEKRFKAILECCKARAEDENAQITSGLCQRICSSSPQTYHVHPGFWGSSQCPSPGAGSAGSWNPGCSSESGLTLRAKKEFIKWLQKGIRRGKKTMAV